MVSVDVPRTVRLYFEAFMARMERTNVSRSVKVNGLERLQSWTHDARHV